MKTFKQVVMVAALVAALALNVSAAEGPKPSGTGIDRKPIDCCRDRRELGRWQAEFPRQRNAVFH